MASISTGIGLVSGIDIEDLVTKLMQIEHRPVDDLKNRIDEITAKKTLFVDITARLLKLKLDADLFSGTGNVFTTRQATSSNTSVLTATANRGAALGNYSFTVKSLVQTHQMVSGGYSSTEATVGSGTITVEMGNGNLDRSTSLDALNGGSGVATGSIYITDRAGRSATVDLSGAITVQEVIDAINSTSGIGVTASVNGDHLVLTDTTGQTATNLSVEEVAGQTTAADLGILGSAAGNTLTGTGVVSIAVDTFLDTFNDGLGVRTAAGLDDFRITRRDGVQINVNISSAQSVGDVLDAINNNAANADGKLVASISADGAGITLADSTSGGGDLSVAALNGSCAAEDLGILGSVSADTLSGKRVVAGLNTVLLRSLNGGAGVASGTIRITNRQGASADVDLSGAESLSQVVLAINAAGINVTASLNASKTGLVLTDSSGGGGSLSVSEVDSTTAADLGILGSVTANALRGTNLQLQYVGENTLLSSLNGGEGVYAGKFRVTNRMGVSTVVDLSQSDDVRIEDVISELNSKGIGVTASINAKGDGILLTDTSGGTGTLKVEEVGGGTTAADLNILGSASAGDPTRIDGSFEYVITVGATDTISDIAKLIKDSGAPVSATVLNDGSRTNPYRLGLVSGAAGSVGRMVIDTGGLGLDFTTTQRAQDAAVLYGQDIPGAGRMLLTSTTNTIFGIVEGLTLNLAGVSDAPVNVSVTTADDGITQAMSEFVDDWNSVIDKIKEVTNFDESTQTAGALLGDPTVMRIEDALTRMISYNVPGGSPTLNRLSRVGVSFTQTGEISFDEAAFRSALAARRSDVEALFTTDETGFGAYASGVIDQLTDDYNGTIKRKNDQYDDQIQVFQQQSDGLEARLAKVQERLYAEFYAMEEALARLQTQKTAIENMPNYLTYSSKNNNQ